MKLRWDKLSHLYFRRMQRLPNLLPALDGLRTLACRQLSTAQVFVDLHQLGLKVFGRVHDGVDFCPTQGATVA